MTADPLTIAAWQLATDEVVAQDLPSLATDALVRGVDCATLGQLAGQPASAGWESVDLLKQVLDELGIEIPSREEAHWKLIREAAAAVVAGSMTPADGAYAIWQRSYEVSDSGDLRIFAGLSSEIDDHPNLAPVLEEQIVAEARAVLARPSARMWIRVMYDQDAVSPLSKTVGTDSVEILADELMISEQLRFDLSAWAAQAATTLDGWPDRGGFDSIQTAETFVQDGEHLTRRLRSELGPNFEVEYQPEPVRPPGVRLRPSAPSE